MSVAYLEREEVEAALRDRLLTVADRLAPALDPDALTLAELVEAVALAVKRDPTPPRAWLLFVAITGVFPEPGDVDDLVRRLDLSSEPAVIVAVLAGTLSAATQTMHLDRRIELLEDVVVVDVGFCATHEHNTGIQRVVREVMPRWVAQGRPMQLVAWTQDFTAMRRLEPHETDRVLHWNDRQRPPEQDPATPATIVVPWNSQVFLPEVPSDRLCSRLAAVAELSGNPVDLIGYDAIPLVSAESQRDAESERFARYLTVVKHARSVIGISESAAEEFRGFVDTLPAQGLVGPKVHAVPLALEVPPAALEVPRTEGARPLVLCVGSHEPRKNQDAVIAAGELLLREGRDFELVFVGGGSRMARERFDRRVARLRRAGYQVRSIRGLADAGLWALYARARFTVFVSLHEGFGLPVAESLAFGVPALTSDYGSLAEIAALGGCVTVDPRDDDAIVAGFRSMLDDDELIAELRRQAAAIPPRGWSDYAEELWSTAGYREERAS